ncbi:hypothetical protein LEL_10430 [Akanthomyces lecanii RCEF 1005]|uniref:Uncharacterized protein n=1 Tax=Akanthomyces lecanii RCEF 1005 TaxID=1081108 RepID=A0A167YHI3_CORDF|nr:hypothetical protein LEL_10430 [Akanthomyces lecanii RCEF 1005]
MLLPLEDRIVPGQETYERCKGTQNIRIPGGDLVRGLCSLREFIVHVTGAGSDRTEFDNLSKNGWTNRDAAHTMNENNFGNGRVRPWAVIKDGGTGYISAVKRASGQVAKVRKVASSNPAVWEVF